MKANWDEMFLRRCMNGLKTKHRGQPKQLYDYTLSPGKAVKRKFIESFCNKDFDGEKLSFSNFVAQVFEG